MRCRAPITDPIIPTTYRGIVAFDLNTESAQAGSSGGSVHDSRGACGYLGIEPLIFILLML